jgi:hypothetical protein
MTRIVVSPWTALKLRAIGLLGALVLGFVLVLISVAVLVDWWIG